MTTHVTTDNPVRSDLPTSVDAIPPTTTRSRAWAIAGIGAGLAGLGTIVTSGMVNAVYDAEIAGDSTAIADKLADQTVPMFAFHTFAMLGAVLLVPFAAGLFRRLQARSAEGSIAPLIAFAGLLGTSIVTVMGSGLDTEFILAFVDGEAVDPANAALYNHWIGTIPWIWALAGLSGLAVYAVGRAGGVPRWIGRVGLVLGGITLLLGISPLQYMAGMTGPLWLLVTALAFCLVIARTGHDVPVSRSSEDEQRPVAWPVAALAPLVALLCVAAIAVLELHVHGKPVLYSFGPSYDDGIGNGLGTGLVGLVIAVLSGIVLRTPGHRLIGWTLAGVGLFWSFDGLSESYVRVGMITEDALPGMTFAVWFLMRFTALLTATIVVLPLIFPDGRFLPGRWGVASWGCMSVMVVTGLAFNVVPYQEDVAPGDVPPGVDLDPTTIDATGTIADFLTGSLQLVSLVGLVVPVAVVVHRYRRSRGTERDQMRWLLWGALVTVTIVVLSLVIDLGTLTNAVFFVAVTLVPIAMTVAVVNPSIVSIEELLGRTLVLALLAAALVAVDLAVVAGLNELLADSLDQAQVILVVLLVTVLLYGPVRQRLSRWVHRLVLGTRATPYDAVAGLASTLETADPGSEQLAAVARSVASAFGVRYVSVEVDRSGGERLVATYGVRPAETRSLPISYRDAEVGRLVLPARGLRSRLSRRDEELLGDLVRQAATAARTSQLADELQESRERLVAAREEERRRIRRDLHDGLGPALSGVVFQLESARLLVDREPEAAKAQVVATSEHVQEVVADVRRLVHDLRPPALDDLGLVGALRQQAQRLDPPATVTAGDLGTLPAAVEVAAFRIASEAMTNVARHAAASTCSVALGVANDLLVVEVADDGVGIPAEVQAGVGLLSLRERAAELGGTSEITCPPSGGTTVRTRLPVRRNP